MALSIHLESFLNKLPNLIYPLEKNQLTDKKYYALKDKFPEEISEINLIIVSILLQKIDLDLFSLEELQSILKLNWDKNYWFINSKSTRYRSVNYLNSYQFDNSDLDWNIVREINYLYLSKIGKIKYYTVDNIKELILNLF